MSKVSVVIPCFNQGQYLGEAVASVRSQTYQDIEIVIVNDGSDDGITADICNNIYGPDIKVLHTENQGLATARNNGIEQAEGIYILPLDADDRIGSSYVDEAVAVLDSCPDIGIVYSKANLFGAVETEWPLPEYSLEEMLKNNIIFCTALYRRSDWELVGGYDPGMIYGWEDYDFWLSLIERGRNVHQLPATHFFYRVDHSSMVRTKQRWQKVDMFKRIYQRHATFIGENIEIWLHAILDYNEPVYTSRLYINEGKGISDQDSISREITGETKIIQFPLDKFVNRKEVRFDPIDCPACIEIHSIELGGEATIEKLDLNDISSNAYFRDGNFFLFETDDPQVFFHINSNQLQKTKEVKVFLNIKSTGEQALREILRFALNTHDSGTGKASLTQWLLPKRKK
ncbi:MAG: glycosyltransferase family 2 protein [Desulfofustis sp.]|nr:glycosyltransferase family 2 protein [Desulfofustis sp.]